MRGLRLLLDQMIDTTVAHALKVAGHDVLRASEVGLAREDDSEILQKAVQDDRILVTLDEHFGDWVVLPLSNHPGVVRVKADPATSQQILSVLLPFIEKHNRRVFRNSLVIVRGKRTRWISTASE